jgi:hypothetical protein
MRKDKSEMTSEDQALFDLLVRNETALIDPISRMNPESLELLLAPTFFEFGCSGKVWERSETIQGLLSTDFPNVDATNFRMHRLAKDVVLLTFRTSKLGADGRSATVLRSSIWKRNEPGWQMVFHQGTKALE